VKGKVKKTKTLRRKERKLKIRDGKKRELKRKTYQKERGTIQQYCPQFNTNRKLRDSGFIRDSP
ncbi:hypothetical protein, partial [Bacteroides salyersiae]|uniref:hypothetical protein n=1 Tax=Bacteroides salyersiae TaxID=291644 RepID=UPI001E28C1C1